MPFEFKISHYNLCRKYHETLIYLISIITHISLNINLSVNWKTNHRKCTCQFGQTASFKQWLILETFSNDALIALKAVILYLVLVETVPKVHKV